MLNFFKYLKKPTKNTELEITLAKLIYQILKYVQDDRIDKKELKNLREKAYEILLDHNLDYLITRGEK